ncbi:MAG TPA: aminoacetone oxidase family FAD-binding enzyme, partial [Epsilonproteobacteria bacterium]|nr:aminoacetone oxidase family FAD-binding enzyme [Campylobacterota bacterium]
MIIIGGGASGLIAAILIAREGIAVTLLEQNSKIGKKILVSGNGKCNITNRHIAVHRFHSQNPPFIESVLQGYDFARIEAFFHSIGVELIEEKEVKVFPMSRQAASVVEMLEYEAQRAGVEIRYDCTVKSITEVKQGFMLHTTQGDEACDLLLLASGSPAAPQLGGTFGGLEMAASLGHALIPAYPSLVQLCSDEVWVKAASGVKVEAVVKLYANSDYVTEKRGDI